ncbi:MAG: hypothetical protein KKF78_11045, partial [Candidatus Omnitrophica bacterium]|nr:hypothetical protein [Candidatus Omnitrophota bacterium]
EKKYADSKSLFKEIDNLKPDYKDSNEYLKKIAKIRIESEETQRLRSEKVNSESGFAEGQAVFIDEDQVIEAELKKTREELIRNALDSIEIKK